MKSNERNVTEPTYRAGTLKGRSSSIYFACIGVAPPQQFIWLEQSTGSNASGMDQT